MPIVPLVAQPRRSSDIVRNPGKQTRSFSEGHFRKAQKWPSGNSLFYAPHSFVLALTSEIDVFGHGLNRSGFERNADASS